MPEIYQLVLAAVYHADGLWGEATFDLAARGDGPWVVAGLEEAAAALRRLPEALSEARIAEVQAHPVFSQIRPAFFEHLRRLRPEAEIRCVPEGTVVQAHAPFLQITAPLAVCTLAETLLMQPIAAGTRVATAAARLSAAAGGRALYDFSGRFWPDPASAEAAARAAWIGGFAATSAAGAIRYGVPLMGTMPSSFLAAYGDDRLAARAFRRYFPSLCHFSASEFAEGAGGAGAGGVRGLKPGEIHSLRVEDPDMEGEARRLRAELDGAGLRAVRLLGSGGIDEARLRAIHAAGVPLDWLAVGRALAEAPDARLSYRIAEMQRGVHVEPVRRAGGARWPGRKQLWRLPDRDVVAAEGEAPEGAPAGAPGAIPLLQPWALDPEAGPEIGPAGEIRQRTREARDRRAAAWAGEARRLMVSGRLRGR